MENHECQHFQATASFLLGAARQNEVKSMSPSWCFCSMLQSQKAKTTQKAIGLKILEVLEIQGKATQQEKTTLHTVTDTLIV